MTDERSIEDSLLHPQPKWFYNLLTGKVTQDPGQDRMGPYDTEDEAAHALQIARKRNEEWQADDDEWNGAKPAE